jgi:putative membrane protein
MIRNLKTSIATVLLVAAVPVLAIAQPGQADPYYRCPGWDHWHMWGGWGFGWLFPVLIIVLLVFFLTRLPWRHRHWHGDHTASALQILSERFAKGEISKEEFEEKRSILARRM